MHYLDVSPIYVRFLKASEILGTSTTMQPWLEHEIAWQETKDFPRQALWYVLFTCANRQGRLMVYFS